MLGMVRYNDWHYAGAGVEARLLAKFEAGTKPCSTSCTCRPEGLRLVA